MTNLSALDEDSYRKTPIHSITNMKRRTTETPLKGLAKALVKRSSSYKLSERDPLGNVRDSINQALMRNMYRAGDDRYIKSKYCNMEQKYSLNEYTFFEHPFFGEKIKYDKKTLPLQFKTTPDTLLNLAAKVVDAIPLPSVYTWTNLDVCNWIKKYGYPYYQNTFRVNLINGRRLLLLDASALSAMNIKNFDHIKHIAHGIRGLFFFELTKFTRSISLAPHFHYELYKLFRTKGGLKYEQTRRTDLWRQLQLLREKKPNYSHWELLEHWLSLEPDPQFPELIGGIHRYKLYTCETKKSLPPPSTVEIEPGECSCIPPCQCNWTERDMRLPWRLECLPEKPSKTKAGTTCEFCIPPCTCGWISKDFRNIDTMAILQNAFPFKYGYRGTASRGRVSSVPSFSITANKYEFLSTNCGKM